MPAKLYSRTIDRSESALSKVPIKPVQRYKIVAPKRSNGRAATTTPKMRRMQLYEASPFVPKMSCQTARNKYLGDMKTFLEEESKNPPPINPSIKPYYTHCSSCNVKNLEFEQINDGEFDKRFNEEYWRIQLKKVERRFYSSFGAKQ